MVTTRRSSAGLVAHVLIVSTLITLASCDIQTSPFETTTSDSVRKFAEGGSRVAVLSFTADPRLSQQGSGGPLQAGKHAVADPASGKEDVPETVLRLRYSQYVSSLSSKYQVVGTIQPKLIQNVQTPDRQWIMDAIKSAGADYGILVHDQYGVDWGTSTLASIVDAYNFRVSTAVYTADGTLVWRFVGRGKAEDPKLYSEPFTYAATGKKPLSATNAANIFDGFIKYYPKLEESLITDDAAGRPHVGEGSDWCKYVGKTYKELALFIVNDKSRPYSHVFRDIH